MEDSMEDQAGAAGHLDILDAGTFQLLPLPKVVTGVQVEVRHLLDKEAEVEQEKLDLRHILVRSFQEAEEETDVLLILQDPHHFIRGEVAALHIVMV
jgi:hypothetical protein